MKVTIDLKKGEFDCLMRLVFLGNYVINGIRREQEQIAEYNALAEKLARLQYEAAFGISGEEAEENELADLRDCAYDEVRLFLEAFEEDVYKEISAEKRRRPSHRRAARNLFAYFSHFFGIQSLTNRLMWNII